MSDPHSSEEKKDDAPAVPAAPAPAKIEPPTLNVDLDSQITDSVAHALIDDWKVKVGEEEAEGFKVRR